MKEIDTNNFKIIIIVKQPGCMIPEEEEDGSSSSLLFTGREREDIWCRII